MTCDKSAIYLLSRQHVKCSNEHENGLCFASYEAAKRCRTDDEMHQDATQKDANGKMGTEKAREDLHYFNNSFLVWKFSRVKFQRFKA